MVEKIQEGQGRGTSSLVETGEAMAGYWDWLLWEINKFDEPVDESGRFRPRHGCSEGD